MSVIQKIIKSIPTKAYIKQENDRLFFKYKADLMTRCAMSCRDSGVSEAKYFDYDVIVSLTTYGKRILEVYLAIESIMQGTIKPNKIILWLDYNFQDKPLPIYLKKQQKRGLEICFCKDIKSYKKLIPTISKYSDSAIITIDDDVIYMEDFVERLINSHRELPECVLANCVEKVLFDKQLHFLPYQGWPTNTINLEPSVQNIGIGVGGILYPPNCFTEEILNEDVFMSICPSADDLWFYSMALLSGRKISKSPTHNIMGMDYYFDDSLQDSTLSLINMIERNGNDLQIANVFRRYNLYSIISKQNQ